MGWNLFKPLREEREEREQDAGGGYYCVIGGLYLHLHACGKAENQSGIKGGENRENCNHLSGYDCKGLNFVHSSKDSLAALIANCASML